MKFISSPLLLTATALLSASVAIAQGPGEVVSDSSGCTDGYCWGSCINVDGIPSVDHMLDPGLSYEDGGDWCWMLDGIKDEWLSCSSDDKCSLENASDKGYMCDHRSDSCGPSS